MHIKEIKDMLAKDHGYKDWDTAFELRKTGAMSANSWDDLMDDILNEVRLQNDLENHED